MKILHTADLHLGSPLRTALARNDGFGAALSAALDGVLGRIVDVALRERVGVVLLAGDIFDTAAPDVTLRARLLAQLRRLTRAGIPVAVIRGNHDALLDHARFGPLGEGIHLLTRETPTIHLGDAAIHGLSFTEGNQARSMLPDYPAPVLGRLNIGLMHTSLDGAAGHDPYAPCSSADLLAHGYDYWALGHIHKRAEQIADGRAIVMPGIPQGRHMGETGGGSVTIATLGDRPDLRQIPVAEIAFHRLALDLTDGDPLAAFATAAPDADGRHHILRLEVTGSDLPETDLAAMARAALEDRADIGLDRLRRTAGRAPARDDLTRLMRAEAATDSFRDEGLALLADLRAALPPEIADCLDAAEYDDLLAEGLDAVGHALRRAAE
ncbi:MAG: DNA repair exonuclease [Pseudomonadota bacterium]